jgi:hypothetical protein
MFKFTFAALTLPSILGLALPVLAFGAPVPSDTVPTSQLTVRFQVSAQSETAGNPTVTALVSMERVMVVNGHVKQDPVSVSADDVVTFSVGQNTITYNPTNGTANALPYVLGATYSVSFKRFNGESYTNAAVMPAITTVTAPQMGDIFKKTDAVNLAWTDVSSLGGVFILAANCGTLNYGGLTYNAGYTAATLPAGAASTCNGPVQMQFIPLYFNAGTGYGEFVAGASGRLQFSFLSNSSSNSSGQETISLGSLRLDQLIDDANRSGNRTVFLNF